MSTEQVNKIKLDGTKNFLKHIKKNKKKYNGPTKVIENYGGNAIIEIKNIKLEKYNCRNLSLKECTVKESSIKYSYICDNSYLRHTKFEKVDFTGTIFENVNLEKAIFENCILNYVRFENCVIDYKAILKSKPEKPNLCINLMKSLYKNELQQGNMRNADEEPRITTVE